MVEWRVYGCGSASSNRSMQTSYEIVDGETRLQVDFGNGAFYQRCRVEGDVNRVLDSITHLFLTHSHPDHTVDLTRLVVAWKYTPGYSPEKPVHLYASSITLQAVKRMLDSVGFGGTFDEVFVPHEAHPAEAISLGTLTIKSFAVHHIPGAMGLCAETQSGARLVFTGDTSLFPGLESHLENLELLVCESSFCVTPHHMHLQLDKAAQLAGRTAPRALLLVHFYPEVEALSAEEIRRMASKEYSGAVYVAHDGLALVWNPRKRTWRKRRLF